MQGSNSIRGNLPKPVNYNLLLEKVPHKIQPLTLCKSDTEKTNPDKSSRFTRVIAFHYTSGLHG